MATEEIITLICMLGILITGIVLLIENFKKNIGWGLASLFCGVPLLVFAIMNFKKVKDFPIVMGRISCIVVFMDRGLITLRYGLYPLCW